jgi:hypothetical protein
MAPEQVENEEGGSLKKKVATGVAVGLATTAAAGVAKKMLDSNGDDQSEQSGQSDDQGEQSSSQDRARSTGASQSGRARSAASRQSSAARSRAGSARRRASSSARSKAKSSSASTGRGANRTKEQLYRQAKRLGVEGRSKMTKAQLERAVARAK